MKNHWLKNKRIFNEPLYAALSCSTGKSPGTVYLLRIEGCKTLDEYLAHATERSKKLMSIGPADKIVLLSKNTNTVAMWNKINEEWVRKP